MRRATVKQYIAFFQCETKATELSTGSVIRSRDDKVNRPAILLKTVRSRGRPLQLLGRPRPIYTLLTRRPGMAATTQRPGGWP